MELNHQNNSAKKKEVEVWTSRNRFTVQGQSQSQEKMGQPIKQVDKLADSSVCWEQILGKCVESDRALQRSSIFFPSTPKPTDSKSDEDAGKQFQKLASVTVTGDQSSGTLSHVAPARQVSTDICKTTVPNRDEDNATFKLPSPSISKASKMKPKPSKMSSTLEECIIASLVEAGYEEPRVRKRRRTVSTKRRQSKSRRDEQEPSFHGNFAEVSCTLDQLKCRFCSHVSIHPSLVDEHILRCHPKWVNIKANGKGGWIV